MGDPIVAVGLPVYNGANYVERSIRSILSQEFSDLELVIGDNGSTDATADICSALAREDDRIKYHRSDENRGAAWNYNRVFELSRARYFKWSSHDDLMDPKHLTACVGILDRFDDTVLAYPQTMLIDGDGAHLKIHPDNWEILDPAPHERFRYAINQHGLHNPTFALMRREALGSTGLIGRFDHSDIVMLAEVALRGKFREYPEPLFFRRMHDGMSRRALLTPRDVAQWFDTSSPRAYNFTWTRLYVEMARAINRAPLSASEKARCLRVLTLDWQWKRLPREYWDTIVEKLNPDRRRYTNWSQKVEA